jgi:hypothetical protein
MVQTPAFGFGSGVVWGTPLSDAYGNTIANPTPLLLGTLQDVSVDFSSDVKELYGQAQIAQVIAAGKMKISGKAKWAQVNMATIASLFFGQSFTSATLSDYHDVTGLTVPASGAYYLNPTAPNGGTWAADLGVRDIYGNQWAKVASAPTGLQYTVTGPVTAATASFATNVMTVTVAGSGSFAVGQVITSAGVAVGTYISSLGTGTGGTGTYNLSTSPGTIAAQAVTASSVYTVPSTAAGATLFVDYQFTGTSTINKTATFVNVAMGTKPIFRLDLFQGFQANALSMVLFQCVATKFSLATKIDDFLSEELDFAAFQNGAGQVLSIGTSQ